MNESTAANLDLSHLVNLIDELRAAGYDVSTQQYIAAQNLLIALAARGELPRDLRSLRTWLAPVICSSPREQENFYRYFDRWVTRHPELTTPAPVFQKNDLENAEIAETENRWKAVFANSSWHPLLLLGVLAVGVTLLFWLRPHLQQLNGAVLDNDTNQRLAGVTISFGGQNQTTDKSGGFSVAYRPPELPRDLIVQSAGYEINIVKVTTDTKSPLEVRLQQSIPLPTESPGPTPIASPTAAPIPLLDVASGGTLAGSQRGKWIGLASVAFPLFIFAGWWLWQSKFNRGLLRRLQRANEPQLEQLIVKGTSAQLFQQPDIRRTIQELRRHRQRGANELDATRTVFSTIDNGGLFTPAYGLRQTLPEYLVLIDRASLADHQAKLDDEFVRRLIQDNVFVDAYHFQGDPRFCRPALRNSAYVSLQEMAAHHPDHHLIIFSEAGTFINPISGAPERWIENFAPWPKRILITPEPPSHWGTAERTLAELGFIVLPTGGDGFAALSDVVADNVPRIDFDQPTRPFPSMLRANAKRWLENHQPQAIKTERLCDQLKIFLGLKGYQWLAACAIYPLLYWEMTLLLGRGLFPDRSELEQRLMSLVRLPWFRYGALPDWLRLRLISSLPPAAETSVRRTLEELFLTMMQQPADGMRLEIATETQPSTLKRLKQRLSALKFKLMFRQYLRNQPPESPLRDYVFLSFMAKRTPLKLSVSLPDTIRRLLFPQGQRALGFRPATALLLAIIFSVSVFFINRRVTAVGNPPRPADRFYSDMTAPEQLQFVDQRMQEVEKAMGGTGVPENPQYLTTVKQLVDSYAGRVGNKSMAHADEDLTVVFGRATTQFAPVISKAFRDRGISPLIGLYVAMSESGYDASAVDKDRDTAGLFGLTTAKAREIGLTAAERLDRNRTIAKAAAFARDVQDRSADNSSGKLLLTLLSYGVQFKPGPLSMASLDDLVSPDGADLHIVDRVLAAAVIGENPRAFRLDMNPLSTYTAITAENSAEIADLVGRLGGPDWKTASARLVQMYPDDKEAVIMALVDAIVSSDSYQANLRVALTLASIKPKWQGTADEIGMVMTLQKSYNYKDQTFQMWVDKAIDNFDRKRIIDCDCANLSAGLLTGAYQKQCATREDQLWQEIKDTGHLTSLCDSVASGPNAKPNGSIVLSPSPVQSPSPTPEPIRVLLTASPTTVAPNQSVTFVVDYVSGPPSPDLQLNFGDGNAIGLYLIQGSPSVHNYSYSAPGTYQVSVKTVGDRPGKLIANSVAIAVTSSDSRGVIPNLIGKPESEVRNMFNPKMEFVLGNVTTRDDASHEAGIVMSQSPVPGTRAPNGTKIDIVVARSPRGTDNGDDVIVPNVVGMTAENAERTLDKLGLSILRDYGMDEVPPVLGSVIKIVRQSPAAGTKVKRGSNVTLTAR